MGLFSFVQDVVDDVRGKTAARAAKKAGKELNRAAIENAEKFQPYIDLGLGAIDHHEFLLDPNLQYQWLQDNPLFSLMLENANTATKKMAAARSRLSAGDTLQQFSDNVLLSARPLIRDQTADILSLMGLGFDAQSTASGLRTSGESARAAGIVSAANARAAGTNNILTGMANLLGGNVSGGFPGFGGSSSTQFAPAPPSPSVPTLELP